MTDIERINELAEKYFFAKNKNEIENELKELILPDSIGLAQINTKAGDIEYNSKKIMK